MKPLSTRTIKILTTGLLGAALFLMMAGPWVIRHPKKMPPKRYIGRIAAYGALLGSCAIGAGIAAYAIMRREQQLYRERAMENMQILIESTRQDFVRKKQSEADAGGETG